MENGMGAEEGAFLTIPKPKAERATATGTAVGKT